MLPLLLSLTLFGCNEDKSPSGYADQGAEYVLREINGASYPERATLIFPEEGRIAGSAPCNSFSGTLLAPYPWFELGPLAVTRRACPDLPAESQFFTALQRMKLIEFSGSVLILSTTEGEEMIFTIGD